eukprot:SAG31_NODE_3828_length_3844_cov_1.490788_4_plen_254_part_00
MKDELDDGKARLAELENRLAETAAVAEGVQIELNGQLAVASADLRTSSTLSCSPCPSPVAKSSSASTKHGSVQGANDGVRQVGDEVSSDFPNADATAEAQGSPQAQQGDLSSPTDKFENEIDSATHDRNGSMGDTTINSSIASLSERINDRMCQEGGGSVGRSSVAHGLIHDISAANPDTPDRRRSTRPGAKKPAVYVRNSANPVHLSSTNTCTFMLKDFRLQNRRTKTLTLNCDKSTTERSRYLLWRGSLLN